MPTKAPTACHRMGCNGLIRNGECNRCGATRRGSDRAYDDSRGTAAQRGYDHTWRKVRRMQLAREPLCYDCKTGGGNSMGGGVITIASEVHHIIAKRDGGTNELDNLMSLCKACHSKRTNRGE